MKGGVVGAGGGLGLSDDRFDSNAASGNARLDFTDILDLKLIWKF